MSEYIAGLALHRRQLNRQRVRGVEKQDLPGYHPCSKCDKVRVTERRWWYWIAEWLRYGIQIEMLMV